MLTIKSLMFINSHDNDYPFPWFSHTSTSLNEIKHYYKYKNIIIDKKVTSFKCFANIH